MISMPKTPVDAIDVFWGIGIGLTGLIVLLIGFSWPLLALFWIITWGVLGTLKGAKQGFRPAVIMCVTYSIVFWGLALLTRSG